MRPCRASAWVRRDVRPRRPRTRPHNRPARVVASEALERVAGLERVSGGAREHVQGPDARPELLALHLLGRLARAGAFDLVASKDCHGVAYHAVGYQEGVGDDEVGGAGGYLHCGSYLACMMHSSVDTLRE